MKKLLLSLALLIPFAGFGQVSITDNLAYTDNFDAMTSTGTSFTAGFSAYRFAGTGTASAQLTPVVTDGSANSGSIYNVGTTFSSDRALGSLSSGSTIVRFGIGFTNNTGAVVQGISISAMEEQWRSGSNNAVNEVITFEYSFNATSISDVGATWTPLTSLNLTEILTSSIAAAAVDGNNVSNQVNKSGIIPSISLANGNSFYIRWTDNDDLGSDGIYALDNFSITLSTSTLPITLTSFTGKEANKSILLNWATASEKNNKNFEVLRSSDGKSFKAIGTINGAGNSDKELKYSFVDANPFGGTNYYQLKQIDFDGKNTTSSTIAVDSKIEDTKITVYATNGVNIGITSPNETTGKISLFDISGRKITEQNISLNKGYNPLTLNENLNPGIHFVTLETEGKLHRQKFIK